MVRPQSSEYKERRRVIVDAAAALFAARGFDGASVAELAKSCNSAKSLIYHYFSTKEDILHEVMADHLDALVAAARSATSTGSVEAQLKALIRGFMDLYVGAEDRHSVLLNELDRLPPDRREEVISKQREIVAIVEKLISELRGGKTQDARALAMLIFGMINWTHTWFRPNGDRSSEQLSELAAELILKGVSPQAS